MNVIASVTEFHIWGKEWDIVEDNEMFKWTVAVSCKPLVLISYLCYQPDKLPGSLVTPNKTRQSFAFATGGFILYSISICIVSIF